jgi:hypothetical protein
VQIELKIETEHALIIFDRDANRVDGDACGALVGKPVEDVITDP